MALHAAENFMKTQNPGFDLVLPMPSYVFGPNQLSRTPEEFAYGSNSILLGHLLGKPGIPLITASVHIDDITKTHVLSLNSGIPAGRYLLASGGVNGLD
jgi:nucleoside-diphosphate-sugar epimerase